MPPNDTMRNIIYDIKKCRAKLENKWRKHRIAEAARVKAVRMESKARKALGEAKIDLREIVYIVSDLKSSGDIQGFFRAYM